MYYVKRDVFHRPGARWVAIVTGKEDNGGRGVGVGFCKAVQSGNAAVLYVIALMNKGSYKFHQDGEAQGQGVEVLVVAELGGVRLGRWAGAI